MRTRRSSFFKSGLFVLALAIACLSAFPPLVAEASPGQFVVENTSSERVYFRIDEKDDVFEVRPFSKLEVATETGFVKVTFRWSNSIEKFGDDRSSDLFEHGFFLIKNVPGFEIFERIYIAPEIDRESLILFQRRMGCDVMAMTVLDETVQYLTDQNQEGEAQCVSLSQLLADLSKDSIVKSLSVMETAVKEAGGFLNLALLPSATIIETLNAHVSEIDSALKFGPKNNDFYRFTGNPRSDAAP